MDLCRIDPAYYVKSIEEKTKWEDPQIKRFFGATGDNTPTNNTNNRDIYDGTAPEKDLFLLKEAQTNLIVIVLQAQQKFVDLLMKLLQTQKENVL